MSGRTKQNSVYIGLFCDSIYKTDLMSSGLRANVKAVETLFVV